MSSNQSVYDIAKYKISLTETSCIIVTIEVALTVVIFYFRYQPMARSTFTSQTLPKKKPEAQEKIITLLAQHESVSITADIWSDRAMRSFLGVTAHILGRNPKTGSCGLLSLLLTCQRFHGRHTGENIAQAFEGFIEEFHIGDKVIRHNNVQ